MEGLDINKLCFHLPKIKGKYMLYVDKNIANEARQFFLYDKNREPKHIHFLAYGKNFFDLDYIGHCLLPETKSIVMEDYKTGKILIQYEIK